MQNFHDYQSWDLKKIIFQNTAAIVIGRIVILLFTLSSSIILVRYLGSGKLGQYASFYAYPTIFGWLTTLGMEQIIVREAAKQRDKAEQIFSAAVVLSSLLSVAATVLAVLGSIVFGYAKGFQMLLFIAAIDMLLFSPLRLPGFIFQAYLKLWYWMGITIARQALWLIVIVLLILVRAQLPAIILGHLLCGFLEALAIFLCARRFVSLRWIWDSAIIRKILKNSWPIALSTLASSIYCRLDQVLLHTLSSDQKLGYYVVAVNIAEFFTIFAIAFTATMFPILSEISLQKERFEYYIKICFRYLMSFLFGICALLTVGSPLIVRMLYGKEYLLSSPVLSILIWSETGLFLGQIMVYALIARGLQKFIPISGAIAAITNIVLNIIWIPKWGPVGAAWATVISYNISGFFSFLIFPATRDLWIIGAKLSYKPFLIGLFCILIFGSTHKLFAIFLIPVLYLSGLFAFQIWNKNDVRLILNLLFKPQKDDL